MKIEAQLTFPERTPFAEVIAQAKTEFPDKHVRVVYVSSTFFEIHDGTGNLVDITDPEWTYTLEVS